MADDTVRLFILHHYSSKMYSSLLSWFTTLHSHSIFIFITWLAKFCTAAQHPFYNSIRGTKFLCGGYLVPFFLSSTPAIICRFCSQSPYSNNVCLASLTASNPALCPYDTGSLGMHYVHKAVVFDGRCAVHL